MRRRVTLVLASLLVVVALTAGGWLLDPAGSHEPTGSSVATKVNPSVSGPVLYAELTAAMAAARTTTYTFSGSTGGGETQAGTGELRFLQAGPDERTFDGDVTLTAPDTGTMRAVLLPGAFYLALPAAKGLPRDKPWLKVSDAPRTELGRQLSPVAEQLRSAFDPQETLGLLRAAGRVEQVGPATVEGAPATEHRTSIDLRVAARVVEDPATRAQYRAMLGAGVRTLDYQLWTGATGLPLKVRCDVAGTPGVFSMTGVFRGWGKPVTIAAPTAKQVFDADSIKPTPAPTPTAPHRARR